MFVNAIVTLPAFALSDVVLKASWPSLFADRLSVCAPALELVPVDVAAGVEVVVEVVAGALVVAGVDVDVLGDDELPQPASAARAETASSAAGHGRRRLRGLGVGAWTLAITDSALHFWRFAPS
jgi:hypothetical protein